MNPTYRTFLPDEIIGIAGHLFRLINPHSKNAIRLSDIRKNYTHTTAKKIQGHTIFRLFLQQVVKYQQKQFITAEVALHTSHTLHTSSDHTLHFEELLGLLFEDIGIPEDHTYEPAIVFSPGKKYSRLKRHLVTYITAFKQGTFIPIHQNHYTYSLQHEMLMTILKKEFQNFGTAFILSEQDIETNSLFLFHHMILAFELEELIEVLDTRCNEYVLRVKGLAIDIPSNIPSSLFVFNDNTLRYDGKVLDIPGTYSMKLLQTLFSDNRGITTYWPTVDIYDYWGYDTDKTLEASSKKRIYHARRKINNAVKMQTQLDSFIEEDRGEERYRLNPLYFQQH